MKTKNKVAIIILILLAISAAVVGAAMYFKIEINKYLPIEKKKVIYTKEQCIESANNWLEKLGKEASKDIEVLEENGIYTLKSEKYEISIDSKTNDISSYKSEKEEYKNQIIEMKDLLVVGNEIYKKLGLDGYIVTGLGKREDNLAVIDYTKKEDNILNIGKKFKITFEIPTKEIIYVEAQNSEYAKNEVKITNLEIKEIAEEYKAKFGAESYDIIKKIIRPTEGSNVDKNETRLAYECKFDTKQIIYVDCTTKEIISKED